MVVFGEGIDLQDFEVTRTAHGYRIAYSLADDGFSVPLEWARLPSKLQFADGSYVWSDDLLQAPERVKVRGSAYDDILVETRPDAEFEGRGGDDVLVGGAGANTYLFNWGDGDDALVDLGGIDTLRFGPEVWLGAALWAGAILGLMNVLVLLITSRR